MGNPFYGLLKQVALSESTRSGPVGSPSQSSCRCSGTLGISRPSRSAPPSSRRSDSTSSLRRRLACNAHSSSGPSLTLRRGSSACACNAGTLGENLRISLTDIFLNTCICCKCHALSLLSKVLSSGLKVLLVRSCTLQHTLKTPTYDLPEEKL